MKFLFFYFSLLLFAGKRRPRRCRPQMWSSASTRGGRAQTCKCKQSLWRRRDNKWRGCAANGSTWTHSAFSGLEVSAEAACQSLLPAFIFLGKSNCKNSRPRNERHSWTRSDAGRGSFGGRGSFRSVRFRNQAEPHRIHYSVMLV